MNNVNSISQMNSVVCEHSSLMGHEAKKGPMMGAGEKGPDGKLFVVTLRDLHRFLKHSLSLQAIARSTHYCHPMTVAQHHHDLVRRRVFAQTRSFPTTPTDIRNV